MYRVAQWVVRHKVLVVAVGAAGFIFFGGNKEDAKPANPWSAGTSEVAVSGSSSSGAKKSLTDKAIGAVSGAAKEYAGIDLGEVKETNDQNWASVTDATKKASE
ncbi:hypothetical protein [Novosphingobium aquae]|jgi:hypothetical protein|uniref:Uncharacterized protein n=1 Tax=Novosphingobium aquae TaxID=3133435 RepID=A0ABU8S656_9SPHN